MNVSSMTAGAVVPRTVVSRTVVALLLGGVLAGGTGCAAPTAPDPGGGARPAAEQASGREFGLATDPWQVDDWADAVGARPTMVMEFEQWHRYRTLDEHFAAARARGLTSFMVTWEPWESVPAELGRERQFAEQPEFSNAAIAAGEQDAYIRAFARSVGASGLTVYLRYAHEMNGDWYPWSRDPEQFVLAWQRIVDLFRQEGARNAKFVFAPNPSLYFDDAQWLEITEAYWPGEEYVDLLGSTMINFGGRKEYSTAEFAERLELMHRTYDLDLIISEFGTAYEGRVEWLVDLRTWLATEADWVVGVVLSQGESRGQTQLAGQVGDLSWDVATDPETQPVIRGMIEDLRRPRGG